MKIQFFTNSKSSKRRIFIIQYNYLASNPLNLVIHSFYSIVEFLQESYILLTLGNRR